MPIQLADFDDAVVFVSLPAIPGDTSNDGFAAIARVCNVVSSGRCPLFEAKLYQTNNSFCMEDSLSDQSWLEFVLSSFSKGGLRSERWQVLYDWQRAHISRGL